METAVKGLGEVANKCGYHLVVIATPMGKFGNKSRKGRGLKQVKLVDAVDCEIQLQYDCFAAARGAETVLLRSPALWRA